jgi:hypothetical protein
MMPAWPRNHAHLLLDSFATSQLVLKATAQPASRAAPADGRVKWDDSVIDNEFMGKKSSKSKNIWSFVLEISPCLSSRYETERHRS